MIIIRSQYPTYLLYLALMFLVNGKKPPMNAMHLFLNNVSYDNINISNNYDNNNRKKKKKKILEIF